MQDLQTTLTGLATIIATICAHYNIVIGPDWQAVIVAVGIALLGYFAKDGKNKLSMFGQKHEA